MGNLEKKLEGKFIVLDGPDGCGKTTQIRKLKEYLKSQGVEIVVAADPGGTPIGDKIRKLVKYGSEGIDVRTEVMLFMASRAQLVSEVIEPALKTSKTVICDRYISSTCAYQGAGGYAIKEILELGKYAVGKTWPNLTIVLDIDPKKGRERIGVERSKKISNDYYQTHFIDSPTADQFDSRTLEYQGRVRRIFLELDESYPGLVKIVDASTSNIEAIAEEIKRILIETSF
ncbi:MAG: dTMP kinase [Sedimentisphaerales bacterium]|nr:dTMP kinase [Sedimentisphaerales bacterium]